ncbi:MAG: M48 family metallopeptidase [Oscillospiraceae bacterium]|nr:M48 family metallopeptidase [Oscillospiraceae bacterium]
MIKSILLNGREISYELVRKNVKNINLRIRSDCSVYVSANARVADSVIEEFLHKKAAYIVSALDKYAEIAKYAVDKHNYVTGESFHYLGKDLRLVVTQGKNNVSSDGVYLAMSVADVCDNQQKEKLIAKWYDTQCREIFSDIISDTFPIFQKYGVTMPQLTLRNMSSRWGSCQPKRGIITLNKKLIEVPRNAVEYVVMHEFVHFLHPNHSTKFYEMLATLMPDWKARKKLLES